MKKISILLLILCSLKSYSKEIILVTDVWEPFRIQSETKLIGIDIDIIKLLEKELGDKIIILQKPWARCLKDMEIGAADLMIGLAYTGERAEYIEYIKTPYHNVKPAFFGIKDTNNIKEYIDLQSKKIGFVTGSSYFSDFDKDNTLNKVGVPRESVLLTMLLRGNIDLFIGTDVQVMYELKKKDLSDKIVKAEYTPDYKIDLYLGISKKSQNINDVKRVEKALYKLLEAGAIDKIINRYK